MVMEQLTSRKLCCIFQRHFLKKAAFPLSCISLAPLKKMTPADSLNLVCGKNGSKLYSVWKSLYQNKMEGTSQNSGKNMGRLVNSEEYTPIYKFPYIVHLKVLSRFKIYQTALTVSAMPAMLYVHTTNGCSLNLVVGVVGIASLACVMLYVMSLYTRKIIGIIAVNQSRNTARVSHLSFWGKRCDLYIPIDDVVPVTDLPDKVNDVYVIFRQFSSNRKLYLSLKFGKICDVSELEHVIGSIK